MAQTAVKFLIEQLMERDFINKNYEIIEQAKAMEKEQIMDAWIATDNELQRLAAEQYYNETYNK